MTDEDEGVQAHRVKQMNSNGIRMIDSEKKEREYRDTSIDALLLGESMPPLLILYNGSRGECPMRSGGATSKGSYTYIAVRSLRCQAE